MPITEQHIQYLEWVEQGKVTVRDGRYVQSSSFGGFIAIVPFVAHHSEILGLTHIVGSDFGVVVGLTARGASILEDEREAWG